ncbi:hypothetical protein QBC45DRAFT_392285 [Copromyces sp. CBS 386.78]|nr:hypothetical protein QBC45DRAFT_392285 [Copromyces sp. CBS 386.78]
METFNLSFPFALLSSISPRMGRVFFVIRRSGRRALVFVPSLGGRRGRGLFSLRRQMASLRRLFPFIRRLFPCSFRSRFSYRRLLFVSCSFPITTERQTCSCIILSPVPLISPTHHDTSEDDNPNPVPLISPTHNTSEDDNPYDTSEDDNLSPVPLISPTYDTSEDDNPYEREPERFFEPGLFRELEPFHFFSMPLAGSLEEEELEEWEEEDEEEGHEEEEEAHTHPTVYISVPRAAPPLPNTRVHVIILHTRTNPPTPSLTSSASSVSSSGPPTRTVHVTFSSTIVVYNPSSSSPSFQPLNGVEDED